MTTTAGDYLKIKRVQSGLSLRDVAKLLGVSHVTVAEFECNTLPVSIKRSLALEEIIPGFLADEFNVLHSQLRSIIIEAQDQTDEFRRLAVKLARRAIHRFL